MNTAIIFHVSLLGKCVLYENSYFMLASLGKCVLYEHNYFMLASLGMWGTNIRQVDMATKNSFGLTVKNTQHRYSNPVFYWSYRATVFIAAKFHAADRSLFLRRPCSFIHSFIPFIHISLIRVGCVQVAPSCIWQLITVLMRKSIHVHNNV